MARVTQPVRIGVDVSKHTLEISHEQTAEVIRLENTPEAIGSWLADLYHDDLKQYSKYLKIP